MLAVIAGGPIHSLSDIEAKIENNDLKEAKRLLGEQIESLRIFSKPLQSIDVDLSSLVDEVVSPFKGDKRQIKFIQTNTAGVSTARGQRDLLRIAIRALVSNAVKAASDAHPPGQGTATVECVLRTDGIWAYLLVGDNGPGVPARIQHRLFTPFNIGTTEGHGLGLFLAEFIAETFHGGIRLVRNVRDQGATFELSLPIRTGR
jgi:signal transduction histidine kinase